jgi:hypothetical protein
VPLHPYVPGSPTAMSWGLRIQVRHAAPPWKGAPIVDCHDRIFPGEGHCVTFVQVFLEFPTPGEGLQDHDIPHYVVVLELVLDGVGVVRVGLLE